MSAPTVPVLSESVLKHRPRLSGVCPPQAWVRMLGVGLAASIILGVIAHYIGITIGWLGGLITELPDLLAGTGGCGIGCVVIFALVAFAVVVVFAYPFLVGAFIGTIVENLGKAGKCRNANAARWAGAFQGVVTYATHVTIAVLVNGGPHVLAVDVAAIGGLFDLTLTGTPWWMVVMMAIEAIILVGTSAAVASHAVEQSTFCEEHGIWYGSWQQARYPVGSADPIAETLESGTVWGLEAVTQLTSQDFPHLLIRTRRCPTGPACDVEIAGKVIWQEKKVGKEGKESTKQCTKDWFDIMVPASLAEALDEALGLTETDIPSDISARRATQDARAASPVRGQREEGPNLVRLCLFREGSAPDEDTALDVLRHFHPEIPREKARSLVYVQGMTGMPSSPSMYATGILCRLHDEANWPDYTDTSRYEWRIHDEGRDPRTGGRTIVLRIYQSAASSRAPSQARQTNAPRSLNEFARRACKSKTTISVQMSEVSQLTDCLWDSLQEEYPDLESGEVLTHAQDGLTLSCPDCGQFSEQVVPFLGFAGMFQNATFGGGNAAALAQGRCPGCGGSSVIATFDPARIKARSAAPATSAIAARSEALGRDSSKTAAGRQRPALVVAADQKPEARPNFLAIASLILGISALLLGCSIVVGAPLGIAAAITGYIGRRRAAEEGGTQSEERMALAGMILGGVSLVVGAITLVFLSVVWLMGLVDL